MVRSTIAGLVVLSWAAGMGWAPPSQAAAPRAPATPLVTIANADFEAVQGMTPKSWQSAPSPLPAGSSIAVDTQEKHGGAASVVLANTSPASLTLISEPVRLRVGRPYRLRAWVKTDKALSDAAARYPTAVPAALSMASFPFTNHSPTLGATHGWTQVDTLFIATASQDRVRLHLGYNGTAVGKAWFDDITLEEVTDIDVLIPPENVRWVGKGYRYDDRGWIFVHIEGEPYERGFQYGVLVADEIVAYIQKLSIQESAADPAAAWKAMRLAADSLFLRGFEPEYLTEMKGIADGAARAGATLYDKPLDFLDVVTVNSAIDLDQLIDAVKVTPNAVSGRSFLAAEEELDLPPRTHKCSALAATGPATADGRVVFGQLFMWYGYTGVHFNVIADVVPTSGHRLVYQTFPGGIHSGTDFYMNARGILFAETTVGQTPFEPRGTPQANRARKAAQYASSIDEVVKILRHENNGLYSNDWPIADIKTNEVAVYLLGTARDKLWRSSAKPAPFGTPGFLWANNNNRDPEVRREYAVQPNDAPFDLAFTPWNRDLAFMRFYNEQRGRIDTQSVVRLWASSPINRPHACDGKVTTAEMAEHLVFLAHYGKVTLREKIPEKAFRRMPELPGASPHLSLGYSVASPVVITEMLQASRARTRAASPSPAAGKATPSPTSAAAAVPPVASPAAPNKPNTDKPALVLAAVPGRVEVAKRDLWRHTIIPASDAENWITSGSAAYWQILHDLPEKSGEAYDHLRHALAELNDRFLYVTAREEDLAAVSARRVYDRYGPYQIPRIKGTFALHQLRLLLGNDVFLEAMRESHAALAGKPVDNSKLVKTLSRAAGRDLGPFIDQWTRRTGLPDPRVKIDLERAQEKWRVRVNVSQTGDAYHFLSSVTLVTTDKREVRPIEVSKSSQELVFETAERPVKIVFNEGNDIPVRHERYFTWSNFADDFEQVLIVYGTSRQIEANHTAALRLQKTLADNFSEILLPVAKDCELSDAELAKHDLFVLGAPADNSLTARLAARLPVTFASNQFRWEGTTYASPEHGLLLALPNPYNPKRTLYLIATNGALELYRLASEYHRGLPSWAIFKGLETIAKGYHPVERFAVEIGK